MKNLVKIILFLLFINSFHITLYSISSNHNLIENIKKYPEQKEQFVEDTIRNFLNEQFSIINFLYHCPEFAYKYTETVVNNFDLVNSDIIGLILLNDKEAAKKFAEPALRSKFSSYGLNFHFEQHFEIYKKVLKAKKL